MQGQKHGVRSSTNKNKQTDETNLSYTMHAGHLSDKFIRAATYGDLAAVSCAEKLDHSDDRLITSHLSHLFCILNL